MKIRDVQARTVVAPLDPPVRTASGHVTQAPLVLIDLATDAGVVGRSYLFGYHPFTLAPVRELVTALGDVIKGDELAPIEIDKKLRSRMTLFGTRGLQGMAVAGIDMAAWDALAVAAGVPVERGVGEALPRQLTARETGAEDIEGASGHVYPMGDIDRQPREATLATWNGSASARSRPAPWA